MSTIFPGSASLGQIFDGYSFNGTAWDIIGIDLTADYLENSTASATYLNKVSASNTYLTQTSASTTYATVGSLNSGIASASAAAVSYLVDSAPATLDTLNELAAALADDANYASTITTALGNKLNISTASSTYLTQSSASTTYLAIESGSTVKTFSTKLNLTQAVYGTVGYNFWNQTYTTNSKVTSKLLITFGVCYECNLDTDGIQLAVSLNGTDEFSFSDTQKSAQYNEMPFYTFISTNSYAPGTVISNLRVYIKALTGNVVCPRDAGTLHNFFLTVQEIAV